MKLKILDVPVVPVNRDTVSLQKWAKEYAEAQTEYAAQQIRPAPPSPPPPPPQQHLPDLRATLVDWLDNNMKFKDATQGGLDVSDGSPALASVSKRLWYFATDDMDSHPFSEVVMRAIEDRQKRGETGTTGPIGRDGEPPVLGAPIGPPNRPDDRDDRAEAYSARTE